MRILAIIACSFTLPSAQWLLLPYIFSVIRWLVFCMLRIQINGCILTCLEMTVWKMTDLGLRWNIFVVTIWRFVWKIRQNSMGASRSDKQTCLQSVRRITLNITDEGKIERIFSWIQHCCVNSANKGNRTCRPRSAVFSERYMLWIAPDLRFYYAFEAWVPKRKWKCLIICRTRCPNRRAAVIPMTSGVTWNHTKFSWLLINSVAFYHGHRSSANSWSLT